MVASACNVEDSRDRRDACRVLRASGAACAWNCLRSSGMPVHDGMRYASFRLCKRRSSAMRFAGKRRPGAHVRNAPGTSCAGLRLYRSFRAHGHLGERNNSLARAIHRICAACRGIPSFRLSHRSVRTSSKLVLLRCAISKTNVLFATLLVCPETRVR